MTIEKTAALIGYGALGKNLYPHLQKKFSKVDLVSDRSMSIGACADYIFLAVKDKDLKALVTDLSFKFKNSVLIHFSGSQYFTEALGLHPVHSFSSVDSHLEWANVPIVSDGAVDVILSEIFNVVDFVDPKNKKAYHAYISVAANSLQLMSHSLGKDFEDSVGVNKDIFKSILIQSLESESFKGQKALSGPWVRGEKKAQDDFVQTYKNKKLSKLNDLFKFFIKEYENEHTQV